MSGRNYILNKGLAYSKAQPLSSNAQSYKQVYTTSKRKAFTQQQRMLGTLEKKLKEKGDFSNDK